LILAGVAVKINYRKIHGGISGGVVMNGQEYICIDFAGDFCSSGQRHGFIAGACHDDLRSPFLQHSAEVLCNTQIHPLFPFAAWPLPVSVGSGGSAMARIQAYHLAAQRLLGVAGLRRQEKQQTEKKELRYMGAVHYVSRIRGMRQSSTRPIKKNTPRQRAEYRILLVSCSMSAKENSPITMAIFSVTS